jgi:alpha-beta hydrolase superfamily lysophospholipase
MFKRKVVWALAALIVVSVIQITIPNDVNLCDANDVNVAMEAFELFGGNSHFDSVESYLKFYGLDFAPEKIEHQFITFQSGDFTLAGHIFQPAEYKATVFILHGFLDHCGLLKNIIESLTGAGYAVAAFDLPGHGLSTGQRAGIENFSQYSKALADFVNLIGPKLKGPNYLIGHSTGGATALDYLLSNRNDVLEKVILVAPLVHCWLWPLSKVAFALYSPFAGSVRRVFRNNSGDKEFLKFVKTDPLRILTVPLKWIRAFYSWNERIAKADRCLKPIKVIQGTSDTTVDWRYNIDFLRGKFSDVEVRLIKKGRHQLFNESARIRAEVFSQIADWL